MLIPGSTTSTNVAVAVSLLNLRFRPRDLKTELGGFLVHCYYSHLIKWYIDSLTELSDRSPTAWLFQITPGAEVTVSVFGVAVHLRYAPSNIGDRWQSDVSSTAPLDLGLHC